MRSLVFALCSALWLSVPVCAADDAAPPNSTASAAVQSATPEPPAVVRFADLGGIRNWRGLREGGLLIEGRRQQFYLATFFGVCLNLRTADAVGFVTDATGSLTQFDSIVVDGERCKFRTLQRVPPEMAEDMR